ncbi:MAG: PAS domain S-box protein [Microscillaceae bacterium]|nr:PAS domain S-box protein [Microscillaceae bacterium]
MWTSPPAWGGAQPRSVLVVPLKLSDRVYGVMELASFYEFKHYQISFLEKLGENIASNLNAAQANERTRRLLEDSNRIAERLRQQEQKMLLNLQVLEDTQKAMQKNQEALSAQSLAIKSTLLTLELNMDRSIGQANDLMLKTVKFREEELLGKSHLELVPHTPADLALYEKLWADLQQGIPCYGEFKRIARDGSEIWLKATYSPIKDKNGRPYKVLKLAFDVTEEKRLRLDFKEQLDSFKRSSAVVEFDLDGKIIDANENFLDLMEYRRDEIIGREHTIIVPDDEKESRAYLALWHKLKQGRYHIGEVRRLTKTGRTVWFQGSFNPILDLNGRPYKIIEFIIDVTDRKIAEASILATKEELQQKEANLTALINNTDDAIYTIGPNYRVTLFNESARRFYESLGENLRVSSNVLELLPKNYEYVWKGYYDRALNGEKFSVEQSIFSEKTNLKFYLSIYFNPILDENEVVAGVSVFSRDISKRKQRELDIAEFTKSKRPAPPALSRPKSKTCKTT